MECEGWAPGSVTNPTQQPGDLSQPRFPYDKGSTTYDVREILEFLPFPKLVLYAYYVTKSVCSRFCKLVSESSMGTPALLPYAQWPRQAKKTRREQLTQSYIQVILSLISILRTPRAQISTKSYNKARHPVAVDD